MAISQLPYTFSIVSAPTNPALKWPPRSRACGKNWQSRVCGRWNISVFHYRNHAAAFGRVLAGVEVPLEDRTAFESYLDELGYPYVNESDNPAYSLFLK